MGRISTAARTNVVQPAVSDSTPPVVLPNAKTKPLAFFNNDALDSYDGGGIPDVGSGGVPTAGLPSAVLPTVDESGRAHARGSGLFGRLCCRCGSSRNEFEA